MQEGVLWGYSPPLINAGRVTVADFLKEHGYVTACFGKWHLGMDMPSKNGKPTVGRSPTEVNVDWKGVIESGPLAVGFERFYGISASLNMPPFIFIDNDRFVGGSEIFESWKKTVTGHPDFDKVTVLSEIGNKAAEFISSQTRDKPFFVYIPLTSPHTPIAPAQDWQGKSGLGSYGDFVMQTDAVVGQIVDSVDASGFSENTLVIVTSDNGCSRAAKIPELNEKGHFPNGRFRGGKADLWEGGHRVPFIARWPAVIKGGSRSNQMICLTDLIATCADLLEVNFPDSVGEDSVSFLPTLSGHPVVSTRAGLVHHSMSGHFAYRQGNWKLLLAKGSGGWTSPTEEEIK